MNKTHLVSWISIIIAILSAGSIYFIPEYAAWFLIVLIINFLIALVYRNNYNKGALAVCRTLIGLLFIFSGFVKGIDPLGTQFKMIDYLEAYNMPWLNDTTLILAILMILAEFIIGICLFLNILPRLATLGAALLMIFFTITTLLDALYDLVPDCGCFGSAIIMSNWQTFYKNIVLDTLLIALIFNNKKLKNIISIPAQFAIAVVFAGAFVGFQFYNLCHLPVIDFMPWKVGNKMSVEESMRKPVITYVVYENNQTGEKQEFVSPNYPYNDSVWMANWTFVSSRIDDPNPRLHNMIILDTAGYDHTEFLINGETPSIIATSYKLEQFNYEKVPYLNSLYHYAETNGMNFAFLTSSEDPETAIAQFQEKTAAEYDIYNVDDVELKMIVRSNPGLFIMKNGVVIGKWHWRDFPPIEDIQKLLNPTNQ